MADLPVLDNAAYVGPVGEIIRLKAPYVEAHPAGMLIASLTGLGAIFGPGPKVNVNDIPYPAKIFSVLVGAAGAGRKGAAYFYAKSLVLEQADPDFVNPPTADEARIISGFPSGAAVVQHAYTMEQSDVHGDVRMMIYWPEFGAMLRVADRQGNDLSDILRQAYDGEWLQNRAKSNAKAQVSKYHHMTIHGHVTQPELQKNLNSVESMNGFGSRFLWVLVHRTRRIARRANIPDDVRNKISDLGLQLQANVSAVKARGNHWVDFEQGDYWDELYDLLCDDEDNVPFEPLKSIVGRGSTHVCRLALILALSDGKDVITDQHLEAAYAIWQYCRASAELFWPETPLPVKKTGSPLTDDEKRRLDVAKVDLFTRDIPPPGCTQTAIIRACFSGQHARGVAAIQAAINESILVRVQGTRYLVNVNQLPAGPLPKEYGNAQGQSYRE